MDVPGASRARSSRAAIRASSIAAPSGEPSFVQSAATAEVAALELAAPAGGDRSGQRVARRVRWSARILPWIVQGLGPTLRYEIENLEALRAARRGSPDGRVIYCCWHGTLLPLLYLARDRGLRIVVSRHRDGEVAARAAERLGCRTVRGSTGRGGVAALLGAMRGEEPCDLALTPDGPRGPRGHFQAGAVFLAARTGLPLVLVGCDADRAWRFASWDRFLLPAPFARVRLVLAEPLFVPDHAGDEARESLRVRAEEALARAADAAARGWS
jgi:lysophospholipid acyltransferase (LPLAT)-like uncharacterized protein